MSSTLALQSLSASQLKSTINSQVVVPYGVYSVEKSGNHFDSYKETIRATPKNVISGDVFTKTLRFDVDKLSLMTSMAIKTSMVSTAASGAGVTNASAANAQLGAKLFSQIEFRCLGRTVQTIYPLTLLAEINDSDVEIMNKYNNATAGAFTATASAETIEVYTPLFWFFDQSSDYWLDFSVLADCEVHCTFNTKPALFSATSNLTSLVYSSSELVQNFIMHPSDIQSAINQKNLNSAEPYTAVAYDFHNESLSASTVTAGEITAKQKVFTLSASTNKHLTISSVFRCRNTVDNSEKAIKRIRVSASGKVLYDVYQDELVLNDGRLGIHLGATEKTSSLHYGITKSKMLPGNLGMSDLHNVIFEITVDISSITTGTPSLELQYGHFTSSIVSINASSGILEKSIST